LWKGVNERAQLEIGGSNQVARGAISSGRQRQRREIGEDFIAICLKESDQDLVLAAADVVHAQRLPKASVERHVQQLDVFALPYR
jgi:hypothetical protein